MKKIVAILAAIMLVCSLTSCSLLNPTQTYTVQEMSITLEGLFYQQNDLDEEMDAIFLSTSEMIMINRVTPDELGLDHDVDTSDVAELFAELMGEEVELREDEGVTYFLTTMDVDGTALACFYTVLISEDACWFVGMIPLDGAVEDKVPTYVKWTQSVTFAEAE
jgi:hypothetical protein